MLDLAHERLWKGAKNARFLRNPYGTIGDITHVILEDGAQVNGGGSSREVPTYATDRGFSYEEEGMSVWWSVKHRHMTPELRETLSTLVKLTLPEDDGSDSTGHLISHWSVGVCDMAIVAPFMDIVGTLCVVI